MEKVAMLLSCQQYLGKIKKIDWCENLRGGTDHPAIAGCARANGANVFPRSPKFATATSPSIDAVAEFLAHRYVLIGFYPILT